MLVDLYPRHVIEFLGVHGVLAVPDAVAQLAREHSNVSILFMDIVGFTPLAKSVHPQEVMHMLNELFSEFDALCNEFGVYKVETIGDCYVVAAGLVEPDEEGFMQISPNLDPSDSAERLLQFSKRMMAHSRTVPVPRSALYVTVSQARDLPITPFTPNTPGIDLPTLFPGTNWHPHRPLCDGTDRLQDA